MSAPVVVLAGGTGGAKLARGMLDVVGDELVVIANTADDIEIYGAHVSPDPDLVTFWLADRIHERGWGLRGDSFEVMAGLRELGDEVWFELGDRDLAIGIRRARRLADGARLTDAQLELCAALGVAARVLPMTDDRVRTWVLAGTDWMALQEFLIRRGGRGPVRDTVLRDVGRALPTPEVLEALEAARAIVVGPSNPVISIGPILAVPELRDALLDSPAPVVAVSPIVGGRVLKGPTEEFMRWAGHDASTASIAACYAGLADGLVADERVEAPMALLQTDTLLDDDAARRRVAEQTLRFADGLRR